MKERPELLMPAGDLEKAKYAFAFGADAVYAGVPMFALRARENKFNKETVKEVIDYAHSLGKKVYLTTNIYPHNMKIPAFIKAFREMVLLQPDAFIVADPGIIYLIREEFPDVELHLSVQQNNVNWASARFWKDHGHIKRIILSREISLKEIKEICEKNPDMEFEAFVHGSICMAYSGRCLLSNYFNYRDANQGTCSHSCRWQYRVLKSEAPDYATRDAREEYVPIEGKYVLEEKLRPGEFLPIDEDQWGSYIMNSRDLCAIDYLQDLVDAGICSLKVEGRSKSVYYAAIVARTYKHAIDSLMNGEKIPVEELLVELNSTGNRGFIPGFLTGNPKSAAQWYEKNGTMQTHYFAGKMLSFDKEKMTATFEARNRVDVGDELEIVTPENIFQVKIDSMFDEKGASIQTVHPGQGIFTLHVPEVIKSEFCVARVKGQQKRNN